MLRTDKIKPITVKSRYRGAIIGTAIGDALGAPFECMSDKDIQKQFPILNDYINPTDVDRPAGIYQNILGLGQWTDDTQLMRPIAWSLTSLGYINPYDIASFNTKVYESEKLRGWGRSTKEAIKRFSSGVHWLRAADSSIGTGNGVAMKAAPLGCYLSSALDNRSWNNYLNSIISVGKLTHHEVGITAGVLQSALIAMSINGVRNKKVLIDNLTRIEKDFIGSSRFTDKLKEVVKMDKIPTIAFNTGTGAKAIESWTLVAAVFLNTDKRRDAINNLFELIKQGGDTDTIGAMYGALIGARWGTSVFPKHLRKGLEKNRQITRMASELFDKVEGPIIKNTIIDYVAIPSPQILVA